MQERVTKGRAAYERRAWADAYEALSEVERESTLDAADLERLAFAALLSGHDEAGLDALERLHRKRMEDGDEIAAAHVAFWLGMHLMQHGQKAKGSGWIATAQRLVDRHGKDCVERGYLLVPAVFRATAQADYETARTTAHAAAQIGDRFGDADLSACGRSLEGRALIRSGRLAEGLTLLDEAMVTAASGALSPMMTGIIYCSVIAGCHQSFALDRAREWTRALDAWCASQPQLVKFTGSCLIHRAQIMQLGGEWTEAFGEIRQAAARFAATQEPGEVGQACYEEGELHRLRGEHEPAERAYARAREAGRDPQPGQALLRLAEGRIEQATAGIRRALAETHSPLDRARLLPACVEILLAASEVEEARRAADELTQLAAKFGMEILSAMANHASAAVRLAEGDAAGALERLRSAHQVWHRAGATYVAARIRVLLSRALSELGDAEGASLELATANQIFAQLGAHAAAPPPERDRHGLSGRELEVLKLVAEGKSNKEIATHLFLSVKTIDRHVSNIFMKLQVTSRAAATAWAYQHGLAG